jgi:hypothetical protein
MLKFLAGMIKSAFSTFIGVIVGIINGVISTVFEVIGIISQGIVDGIVNFAGFLLSLIEKFIKTAISIINIILETIKYKSLVIIDRFFDLIDFSDITAKCVALVDVAFSFPAGVEFILYFFDKRVLLLLLYCEIAWYGAKIAFAFINRLFALMGVARQIVGFIGWRIR